MCVQPTHPYDEEVRLWIDPETGTIKIQVGDSWWEATPEDWSEIESPRDPATGISHTKCWKAIGTMDGEEAEVRKLFQENGFNYEPDHAFAGFANAWYVFWPGDENQYALKSFGDSCIVDLLDESGALFEQKHFETLEDAMREFGLLK